MQQRGGGHRDVAPDARAHEHQVTAELLAEIDELRRARPRLVNAAVVDRMGFVAFLAGHFGERRNLATPGATFLPVGEDDVSAGHGFMHGWIGEITGALRIALRE